MDNYFYKNLYEILGIEPTDDIAKIKSAYRVMARKYHPDLNDGNEYFVAKFKEITQACEILTDKDKKKLYDTFKGYNKPTRPKTTQKEAQKAYKQAEQKTKSFSQEKNTKKNHQGQNTSFSDVLTDIMDGLFGANTQKATKKVAQNGTDITTEIVISYIEALNGTNRTVNILHSDICPSCEGKKFINGAKCPLCNGSGESSIHKKINVKIPKNIKENAKIRIPNEGNRGLNGGKNGDVYLIVKIENDEKYSYDGLNVFFEEIIFPHEALLGAEIDVETPQGKVSMKIPSGTHQGQKFRLSSHGVKNNEGKIGDAIVTVRIDIPNDLSEQEKELYKQISKINHIRKG